MSGTFRRLGTLAAAAALIGCSCFATGCHGLHPDPRHSPKEVTLLDTAPVQKLVEVAGKNAPIERRVQMKVGALALLGFGGDFHRMFDHYAGPDGKLGKGEAMNLLEDAHVGKNDFERSIVAGVMVKKIDGDKDRAIDWPEFSAKLPAVLR